MWCLRNPAAKLKKEALIGTSCASSLHESGPFGPRETFTPLERSVMRSNLIALVCVALGMCGCAKSEPQQATLRGNSKVEQLEGQLPVTDEWSVPDAQHWSAPAEKWSAGTDNWSVPAEKWSR
jgi:hypothetical protein